MTTPTFEDAVSRIVRKDPRFAERAYSFLKDALDFTMQRVEERENGSQRHVSGQELLEGFRDYALAQFGPMASTVMKDTSPTRMPVAQIVSITNASRSRPSVLAVRTNARYSPRSSSRSASRKLRR